MDDTIQAERWRALDSRVRRDVDEYERLTTAYLNEVDAEEGNRLHEERERVSRRVMYNLVLLMKVRS
jgi:hypothetical protein